MLINIIVPVRDHAHSLAKTLCSVLSQEGVELEVVVLDDASVDDPSRVVDSIDDPRVRLITARQKFGVCSARNLRCSDEPRRSHFPRRRRHCHGG